MARYARALQPKSNRQDAFIDLESSNGFTLYGMIGADLGPNRRISGGASYQKDERDGVMWVQLPYWHADGSVATWSRSRTTGARWNEWGTVEKSAFIRIEHDLGRNWSLRGDVCYFQQTEDSKLIWLWGSPDRVSGLKGERALRRARVGRSVYTADIQPQPPLHFGIFGGEKTALFRGSGGGR